MHKTELVNSFIVPFQLYSVYLKDLAEKFAGEQQSIKEL